MSLRGKTERGSGESKALALANACRTHCVRHDSLLDGKHRVWKAAGGKSSGDKAQDIDNVAPLRKFRDQCEQRCQAETTPANTSYEHCSK